MKILSQVGSLLSSLQGNKILKKLTKKKDDGFYRSEVEFKQALKNNLIDIATTQDQPLYVPSTMRTGIAYSEVFNNNMEEILLDLEVLFDEINFLFSKIKSHEVFFDRTITEGEILLKKLEQNIESAKIEASPDNSFNKIFHNSFIDASNKVDFSNPLARELYYDIVLGRRVAFDNLCNIDVKQGTLSLPKFNAQRVPVSDAQILTTESTVSDFDLSFPGNTIANIISPEFIKSWSYSILKKKALKEPARLVILLDLGDIKEFNTITISPNAADPIYLEDVYIVDSNGVKTSLELESGLITESKTFLFKRLLSRAIYFAFKQDRNKIISYDPSQPISLAELQQDPSLPLTIDTISGQIQGAIKDPSIKGILGLQRSNTKESLLAYHYGFSLNSIAVSNDDYKTNGVYVSKAETFTNLRNIGLYVKDMIPKAKHWQSGLEMPAGSIEYVLYKRDFNNLGKLIKSSTLSILPVGTSKVTNERLYFDRSSTQVLRFIGHRSNGDGSEIKVYRNGEVLVRGIDWYFKTRQSSDISDHMIDTNELKTIIVLTQNADQIYNGVYWAEYTPRFVAEPENVVIDNGVRFLENCSIVTPNIFNGQAIERSDVYVQIIIRNHSDTSILTPYVDYYRLAGKEE